MPTINTIYVGLDDSKLKTGLNTFQRVANFPLLGKKGIQLPVAKLHLNIFTNKYLLKSYL